MTETEKILDLPAFFDWSVREELPTTELPILGSAIEVGVAGDSRGTTDMNFNTVTSLTIDSSLQADANIVPRGNAPVTSRSIPEVPCDEQAKARQRILIAERPVTNPAADQTQHKAFTYLGLGASAAGQSNGEIPVVVYEHPSYWVVRKPFGWPSHCGKREKNGSGPVAPVESTSEYLAMFVRSMYPEIKFPILWSRQHNFGVIFILEESWFGLTVIAKSEDAFLSLETIVESQLFHCYLECFVTGPPLRAVTKLFGKTTIGKAMLCVEVLQSTVCRTAGGRVANCVGTSQSCVSVPNRKDVVSNVILRVNFPPALLSDILLCNGMTIAPDPYAAKIQGPRENVCTTKLCCFGISIPSFGLDNVSEICPSEEAVASQNATDLSQNKQKFMAQGIRARTTLVQPPSGLSTYRIVLYGGMIAAAPVACILLSKATSWGLGTKSAAALVERILHMCIVSVSGLRIYFRSNSPCQFTALVSPNGSTAPPLEPEILFGHREAAPWLKLFEQSE